MGFHYYGRDAQQRADGLTHALAAARRGELVAANIDGAYALLTDAFSHSGVEQIVKLKARPNMSVPVLVPRPGTVDGVALLEGESGAAARVLMRDCWPGPLTLLARVQPSLPWRCTPEGVVALRMPMHPWTLELVRALGPTACVPSHSPEQEPHRLIAEVEAALGAVVGVYLDGGPLLEQQTSSIVDVTGAEPRLLREGGYSRSRLQALLPSLA